VPLRGCNQSPRAASADDVLEAWVRRRFADESSLITRRRARLCSGRSTLSPDDRRLATMQVGRRGPHDGPDAGSTATLWSSVLGPRVAPQAHAGQGQGKGTAMGALVALS